MNAAVGLRAFHGGLPLAGPKSPATRVPPRACPPPAEYVLPLLQHAGEPALPTVAVGARVRRGQRIATAQGRGAHLHAPDAGHVVAIEARPVAYAAGAAAPSIVIARAGSAAVETRPPRPDCPGPPGCRSSHRIGTRVAATWPSPCATTALAWRASTCRA